MSPDVHQQIEALLAQWARCIDTGRASEAIDLFTEDAEQRMPSGTATGRAAIGAGLARRQAMQSRTTRHLVSNLRLEPIADTTQQLAGHWVLTLFRSDGTECPAVVQVVADIDDLYQCHAGRWQIARRVVTPIFGGA